MKKSFLLIITLLCVLAFSFTVSAETYSGSCGTGLTWTLDADTYTLTISGTGYMTSYSSTDAPWKEFEGMFDTVIIESGVTSVSQKAFYGNKYITCIELPDTLVNIHLSSFEDCTAIEELSLPFIGKKASETTNTHFGYIFGASAYTDNGTKVPANLKKVTVRGGKIADNAFAGCTSITEINFTSGVGTIALTAFDGCTSLEAINIDGYTSECSSVDGVLYNRTKSKVIRCPEGYALPTVSLPSNTYEIGESAFKNCAGVAAIDSPLMITHVGKDAFDGSAYYNDGDNWTDGILYYKNTMVEAGTLPSVVNIRNGVTTIPAFFFSDNKTITQVNIPESVTTIGEYAFSLCTNLKTFTLPSTVTSVGRNIMYKCTGVNDLTIPSGTSILSLFGSYTTVTETFDEPNYTWESKGADFGSIQYTPKSYMGPHLTTMYESCWTVTLGYYCSPKTLNTVTLTGTAPIPDNAFEAAFTVNNLYIPAGVTSIGANAFDCTVNNVYYTDLSQLALMNMADEKSNPVWKSNGTVHINGNALTTVTVSDSITEVKQYTLGAGNFTDITLHSGITKLGTSALSKNVHFSDVSDWFNIDFDGISGAVALYSNGTSVTDIIVPDGVTRIDAYSFKGLPITSVSVTSGVIEIGEYAFADCTDLETVQIADTVKRIGTDAFVNTLFANTVTNWKSGALTADGCILDVRTALSGYIKLPEGTRVIGDSAFLDCTKITSVLIPDGVTDINAYAFKNCTALLNITVPASVDTVGEGAFENCASVTVYGYTDTAIEAYCTENNIAFVDLATSSDGGHTYGMWIVSKNATCTVDGTEYRECSVCGAQEERPITASHDYKRVTAQPYDCVDGYVKDICQVCGDSITIEVLEAHEYEIIDYEDPTCDMSGWEKYYCYNCSASKYVTIPALGHDFTPWEDYDSEPCWTEYTEIHSCMECGYVETRKATKEPSHAYSKIWSEPATCTEGGTTKYQCVDCSDVKVEYTDAKGHSWSDWTEEADGCVTTKSRSCSACNEEETETTGKHDYTTDYLAPTCTTAGYNKQICSACGDEINETLSATGHSWSDWTIAENGDKYCSCSTCGKTQTVVSNPSGTIGTKINWTLNRTTGVLSLSGSGETASYSSETAVPWYDYASEIKRVIIGNGITAIGSRVFMGCTALTELVIPEGVTKIGTCALMNCSALTDVTISSTVAEIGTKAFTGCTALSKVHITDFVSWCSINFANVESNPIALAHSFYIDGEHITEIELPESITVIKQYAFRYSDLEKITVYGNIETVGSSAFKYCENLTIYGYGGTALHTYAQNSAIPFVVLECKEHTFGDWTTTLEPTYEIEGEKSRQCSVCDKIETESIPKLEAPESADAIFTLADVKAKPGETIKVGVSLKSQAVINSIAFSNIVYDSDILEFVGFADYEAMEEIASFAPLFDSDRGLFLVALAEDTAFDGFICSLEFKVKDDITEAVTYVSGTPVTKLNNVVVSSMTDNADIAVRSYLDGDIDMDEDVDIDDAVYLFGSSMLPDFFPVTYPGNIDFDNNGYVDLQDALAVFRYSMLPDVYPLQ